MLNPITYTEAVVGDFLRYQLTIYPFADERLHQQMRTLLNLEETRNTPMLRGPYISLSRAFRRGASVAELVDDGVLHPHMKNLTSYEHVYGHQEEALKAIHRGKTTLIATGTGSGKTECFLYPIISHCLRLRDEGAAEGIVAVLVYPMNALAEDQLGRLRGLLAGTGVTFGMYVGKTPEQEAEVSGKRLPPGSTRQDYLRALEKAREDKGAYAVHPAEERVFREDMRTPGRHPRILLTNVKQLELLLTRQRDVELFDDANLRFLVFDEAHTFSGAQGGETACLIRRLRAFCGKKPDEVACIATSATVADPQHGPDAGREFASRFFGVDRKEVRLVGETYEEDTWASKRKVPDPLPGSAAVHLQNVLEVVREVEGDEPKPEAIKALQRTYQLITGNKLETKEWKR
ncbi:MAG: DEAD/DEAH box helicase, partial [Myxococcales bacterium]|nr:DEAD/DEAH box helicase [Myxococcales bacterium]